MIMDALDAVALHHLQFSISLQDFLLLEADQWPSLSSSCTYVNAFALRQSVTVFFRRSRPVGDSVLTLWSYGRSHTMYQS